MCTKQEYKTVQKMSVHNMIQNSSWGGILLKKDFKKNKGEIKHAFDQEKR